MQQRVQRGHLLGLEMAALVFPPALQQPVTAHHQQAQRALGLRRRVRLQAGPQRGGGELGVVGVFQHEQVIEQALARGQPQVLDQIGQGHVLQGQHFTHGGGLSAQLLAEGLRCT